MLSSLLCCSCTLEKTFFFIQDDLNLELRFQRFYNSTAKPTSTNALKRQRNFEWPTKFPEKIAANFTLNLDRVLPLLVQKTSPSNPLFLYNSFLVRRLPCHSTAIEYRCVTTYEPAEYQLLGESAKNREASIHVSTWSKCGTLFH